MEMHHSLVFMKISVYNINVFDITILKLASYFTFTSALFAEQI